MTYPRQIMLTSTFISLLSSSECVSRGSSGGGTVGELAPSLLTAPWWKEELMLAGDIESNPGPYTINYVGKNLCMVLMHIPTSSYLLTSKYDYREITSCGICGTFSSKSINLKTKITVSHNLAMPLLICVTYHGNM